MEGVLVGGLVAAASSCVLAAAVVGKVADRPGWRILTVRAAGAGRAGTALWLGLPVAEALVALLALAAPRAGLVAAGLLLAALAIGVQRLRGRLEGAPCACFGPVAPGRIGGHLARRNALLAAIALAAAPLAPVTGPPSWTALVLGAVAAALLLGASRLPRRLPRLPLAPGSRLRLADLPEGRPSILVLLSPGCPPCRQLAERLRAIGDVTTVPIVVGVRPADGAAELEAIVGDLARPGLWARATRYRNVRGTPLMVALGEDRRVLEVGPADAERILELARDWTPPLRPLETVTRATVMRAAAVAVGALAVLPAAAAAARRPRANVRKRRLRAAWDYKNDPRNNVTAPCKQFVIRNHRGVYSATGEQLEDVAGYTWAEGFEAGDDCASPPPAERLPTSAGIDSRRVTHTWRGHCPCPQRMQNYTDQSKCNVECPSGLACFGYQCQTDFEEYCVEVLFTIKATKRPKIEITTLRWTPPPGASSFCNVYANSWNDFVVRHEEHHAQDVLDVLKQWEGKNDRRYLRRCAPTELEADLAINAAIAAEQEKAYADLMQMSCARNASFHRSGAGKSGVPNCELCP